MPPHVSFEKCLTERSAKCRVLLAQCEYTHSPNPQNKKERDKCQYKSDPIGSIQIGRTYYIFIPTMSITPYFLGLLIS